jgi:histidine triad (HIT) family protein
MDNCVFCRIISGEIPSLRVYEDEECIAALDINPASPGHTLIIPKVHRKDLTELNAEEIEHCFSVAKLLGERQLARLGADGFNLVQNNGPAAGQTVLHFHIHVIPRYAGGPQIAAWKQTEPDPGILREIAERLLRTD